jgi:lysine 2,3-aminomutase
MTKTLRALHDLEAAGLIEATPALDAVAARYAIAITPALADLIEAPNDPIARQFVPHTAELESDTRARNDPIGDFAHSPVPGIVHRHPDRVLLKVTAVCPVYCRFCFRREMVGPGKGEALSPDALDKALAYIAADPKIWEVILTGGDPFMLSEARIAALTERLAAIDHIRIARWHTRMPVADPDRVTPALAQALKAEDLTTYVVLHTNHPRELTAAARRACAALVDAGIPMLSQTVLLKGVNDDPETLEALMRALVENRVKPYYLHHPDLAPGTAHFRPSIAAGQALTAALHARASGLCQPTYVLDIPGGYGKVPLMPGAAARRTDGLYEVRDDAGMVHLYKEI